MAECLEMRPNLMGAPRVRTQQEMSGPRSEGLNHVIVCDRRLDVVRVGGRSSQVGTILSERQIDSAFRLGWKALHEGVVHTLYRTTLDLIR